MQGETGERWEQLCAQAAEEQDPETLMLLIDEINRLLDEKEQGRRKPQAEGTAY